MRHWLGGDELSSRQAELPAEHKERNYGVDALRLFSMYMIVVLHIQNKGGATVGIGFTSPTGLAVGLVHSFVYCCVDCFALISGYVGVSSGDKPFHFDRYIRLWIQVCLYSFGISLAFRLINPALVSSEYVLNSLLPIQFNRYWYFTAYTGLFLLMPGLNVFLCHCEQRALDLCVFVLTAGFIVYPCIIGADPFGLNDGYSFAWLAILYVIGGWAKKHAVPEHMGWLRSGLCLAGCLLATWISVPLFEGRLLSFSSPTVAGTAFALLALFALAHPKPKFQKLIAFLSPAAFGVYLIHMHPVLWDQCLSQRFTWITRFPGWLIPLLILGCAAALFTICLMIERVRLTVFRAAGIDAFITRFCDAASRFFARSFRS